MIVHDNARDIGQQRAASGAGAIEGRQGRAGHVQPLRPAADAQAGLVHMLHRRADDQTAHCPGKAFQASGAGAAHAGDGRGGELHAKQIGHQRNEAFLAKQLLVGQIDHEGGAPRAILHRRVHPVGKRAPRPGAAARTFAKVSAVFGDDEGPQLGQIEHLACCVIPGHAPPRRFTAARAG